MPNPVGIAASILLGVLFFVLFADLGDGKPYERKRGLKPKWLASFRSHQESDHPAAALMTDATAFTHPRRFRSDQVIERVRDLGILAWLILLASVAAPYFGRLSRHSEWLAVVILPGLILPGIWLALLLRAKGFAQ